MLPNEGIRLGLKRILSLFPPAKINFNAVHVAGTNGKGTVCFYAARMLQKQGLCVGRFTSPHLIDRWDCINIDGKPVDEGVFKNVEKHYRHKNQQEGIGASSFEILAASAFDIFNMHGVEVGVIEVGVGGREDATNILPQDKVLCSVITQIGLDHQNLLGDTVAEIAQHKAGIIRPDVPCVYDGESPNEAVEQIMQQAASPEPTPREWRPDDWTVRAAGLKPLEKIDFSDGPLELLFSIGSENNLRHRYRDETWIGPFGDGYRPNGFLKPLATAARAVQLALLRLRRAHVPIADLMASVNGLQWPGRLQSLSLEPLIGRQNPVLIDGAHNTDSAARLGAFVAHRFRTDRATMKKREAVTWLLGVSAGKDVSGMLKMLLRDGDVVIATNFGPVDGMPWVTPTPPQELLREARKLGLRLHDNSIVTTDVTEAITEAATTAGEGPMIIAGSLYLVSDVLRLLRASGSEDTDWWQEWESPVNLDKSLWIPRSGHNGTE